MVEGEKKERGMEGRGEQGRRGGLVQGERRGGLLTLGCVGGVGLAMMALTRGLARGFACGTFCWADSHVWRDRPTQQPLQGQE